MGSHLGPFGIDYCLAFVVADAGLGDWAVDATKLAEGLKIGVHLLVADDGKGKVVGKIGIFIFVEDGFCHGVEVDIQGIMSFLGGDMDDVSVDVGAAEFCHIGVTEGRECAEAEKVAGFGKCAGFLYGFMYRLSTIFG